MDRADRFRGLIVGTAVGDSLGYPAENMSARRIARLYRGRWRHRFVLGHGMVSDDTDHTVFVAQALLAHPEDVDEFSRRLAMSLRWWLLGLPVGIGGATLRGIARLWLGFGPARSGVFSAGNGAAMRSAILGAYFAEDRDKLDSYLAAQTRITHTDPKALVGAAAVAHIAAWTVRDNLTTRPSVESFQAVLTSIPDADEDWTQLVTKIVEAARREATVAEFADMLGLSQGVTGYVYHTVPVAVYAWYRHFADFEATVAEVMDRGGDTDTAGAIAGALAGVTAGETGIPADWIAGIADWPRGTRRLRLIADRLAAACETHAPSKPVPYFWPAMLPRNLIAFALTLLHLAHRALPPY